MTTILGAGSVGYDDYQRIANYDSGELYSFTAPPSNSTFDSPVLPVLRWAYLAGSISMNTGPCVLTFTWSDDALGVDVVAQRTIILSQLITNKWQFRLLNLAPYVQIRQAPIGAANYGSNGRMYGSNRVSTLEAVPNNPILVNAQAVVCGVGATIFYPTDYYAGAVTVAYALPAANMSVGMQLLDTGGAWDSIFFTPATAGVLQTIVDTVVPAGAWRSFVINNSGGSQTCTVAITPSMTGSS
jgi:hypothetical protein